ncbi:cell division control protein 6 homolog [Nilaparvata lugens]|uniref:cell division control protein 6 homolog n=1 Tax=Nilaparvata lugens TaxID=108931 RepID=UPI00193E9A47|nr:cell division control protein 6 homolog [Nilaparvata lugens]XP_022191047.2 cell division control protein 6 homolog [Nilaparvata lugens]XP_022191048.2 cell division control protein 6 homolog [Nilaparvata lugens]
MAPIQTKIPFGARKKATKLIPKTKFEKENCAKNPDFSPKKAILNEDEKKNNRLLLEVNSPSKRKFTECSISDSQNYGMSPAKRGKSTPSTLLSKLSLTSPSRDSPSRKRLFPDEKNDDYQEAVRALHSTAPQSLPCRDDKISHLRQFLESSLNERKSGTLYISGPPGTGKTASLNFILNTSEIREEFKVVCINCTSIRSQTALYNRISEELGIQVSAPRTERKLLAAIEKYITSSKKMTLLILDELDQLESKNQSLLYTVFEWPSLAKCQLVLIGIANALDLTDRMLPRLQARLQLKPQLLHFPPYSRVQIIEIISHRLKEAGVDKIFPQNALQLLASKVAAMSGDVRRAFDMARRVIELSHEQSNIGDDKKLNGVTLTQVMNVVSNVYGTSQSLSKNDDDNSESFPLQQKLLLCSVLLLMKQGKIKDITVGKLHEAYTKVCDKRNLQAVDISELISLIGLLESRGVLKLQGKTKNRLSKINLQWDEKEMVSTLKDKKLLAAVLEDKF